MLMSTTPSPSQEPAPSRFWVAAAVAIAIAFAGGTAATVVAGPDHGERVMPMIDATAMSLQDREPSAAGSPSAPTPHRPVTGTPARREP